MFEIKGKYTSALVTIDVLEEECVAQITKMTNHPAFTNPIAIMPDAHTGKGSCIGFTMKVTDKVIPSIVGVDLGCGMLSCKVSGEIGDLAIIDEQIRANVPFGKTVREQIAYLATTFDAPEYNELFKRVGISPDYALKSLGSVGSGNHFCEFGKDETGAVWITVHTGSRNLGKKVCEYWQNIAVENAKSKELGDYATLLDDIKMNYPKSEWNLRIKDLRARFNRGIPVSGLEYLEGSDLAGYLEDMYMAQLYAVYNRTIIMDEIISILGVRVVNTIETIHNFIDPNDGIIRKGSVRSYVGEHFVLPFNMSYGLFVCEGKSNPDWNYSAPHGAGRVLSRSKAKATLDMFRFRAQMAGVFSTSVVQSTLDEAPDAYKDPEMIERAIEPTATILHRVKPFYNMKDKSEEKED